MSDRPMNGWAQSPSTRRWHQVEYDSRTGLAVLRCSGRFARPLGDEVLDYRWRPSQWDVWCHHPQCREEVQP